MSISARSQSSSIFSLASTVSPQSSAPTSPKGSRSLEKPVAPPTPLVLEWKPQLFSTAFSSTRSAWLHFTAFPPLNVPKHTFERLSLETAIALLHQDGQASVLSLFANQDSSIDPTRDIPFPSNLSEELVHCLRGDEWDSYIITNTDPLPIGIGNMTTTYRHHVAFRKICDGVERFMFGPGGLCVHSVCQITDRGARYEEPIPRETLYVEEKTEVLCNTVLKWWVESRIAKKTAEAHENFRRQWDERFRAQWGVLRLNQKVDLLA